MQTNRTNPPPFFIRFFMFISFLSWECRDIEFLFFSGVNVRVLCVVGFAGGGTPGHLFMGGGVFRKKTRVSVTCVSVNQGLGERRDSANHNHSPN